VIFEVGAIFWHQIFEFGANILIFGAKIGESRDFGIGIAEKYSGHHSKGYAF